MCNVCIFSYLNKVESFDTKLKKFEAVYDIGN